MPAGFAICQHDRLLPEEHFLPTKIVPRDVNDVELLTAEIAKIEKGRGSVVQVLEVGLAWVIVYVAGPKKAETR